MHALVSLVRRYSFPLLDRGFLSAICFWLTLLLSNTSVHGNCDITSRPLYMCLAFSTIHMKFIGGILTSSTMSWLGLKWVSAYFQLSDWDNIFSFHLLSLCVFILPAGRHAMLLQCENMYAVACWNWSFK